MEPKKPRSKVALFAIIVVIILIGFALYYVAAIRNSDTRPRSVQTQSAIDILSQR